MRRLLFLAVSLTTLAGGVAYANHERTGTLSSAAATYTWEGGPKFGFGPGSGVPFGAARCTPVYMCEDTLLELKEEGKLVIDVKAGGGSNDLDLRLYQSDAEGTFAADATPMAEDIREEPDAHVERRVKAGWYVAQVAFYNAQAGTYNGSATLELPPPVVEPPATPPPPPAASQPPAKKKSSAKAKCRKKAKKIKNRKKRAKALKRCNRRG